MFHANRPHLRLIEPDARGKTPTFAYAVTVADGRELVAKPSLFREGAREHALQAHAGVEPYQTHLDIVRWIRETLEPLQARYNPSLGADHTNGPAWSHLLVLLRLPRKVGLQIRREQNLSVPGGYVEEGHLWEGPPRADVLTGEEAIRKAVFFAYRDLSADVSDLASCVEAYQDLERDAFAGGLRLTQVWAEVGALLTSALFFMSVRAVQLGASELVRISGTQRLDGGGATITMSGSSPAKDWTDKKVREFFARPEEGSAPLWKRIRDVFTQGLQEGFEAIAA